MACDACENFEKYTGPSHMLLGDYIIESGKLYTTIKNFDMTLNYGVEELKLNLQIFQPRRSNSGSYNRDFNRKSRKRNPVKKDGGITRSNVVGQFTIGQSLFQIHMNISTIQNMIRKSE